MKLGSIKETRTIVLLCFLGIVFGYGLAKNEAVLRGHSYLLSLADYDNWHTAVIDKSTHKKMSAGRKLADLANIDKKRTMVLVALGQSNAANFGEMQYKPVSNVFNFYEGNTYLAKDPILGGNGRGGSVWMPLAELIINSKKSLSFKHVIISNIATGGTAIDDWIPGGAHFDSTLNRIRSLRENGWEPTHFLWHQGEQDAFIGTDQSTYHDKLLSIISGIRNEGFNAPFYIAVASRCKKIRFDQKIQDAQKSVWDEKNMILPGPNTDSFGFAYRYDGCHFTREGQEIVAQSWFEAIFHKKINDSDPLI